MPEIYLICTEKSDGSRSLEGYWKNPELAMERINSRAAYWQKEFDVVAAVDLDGNYGKLIIIRGGNFVKIQINTFDDQEKLFSFEGTNPQSEIQALKGTPDE